MNKVKKYTVGQIKEMLRVAVGTFVAGEDNSWKCGHNLKILLDSIDISVYLENKTGTKIAEYEH